MEKINPLNIPLVVSMVLKYVGYQDLLNARLICRSWGKEAIKCMQPMTKIRIRPHAEDGARFKELVTPNEFSYPPRISLELSVRSFKSFYIKVLHTMDGRKHIEKLFRILGDRAIGVEICFQIACQTTIWKILSSSGCRNLTEVTVTNGITFLPIRNRMNVSDEMELTSVKVLRVVQTLVEKGFEASLQLEEQDCLAQQCAFKLMQMFPNLEVLKIENFFDNYGYFVNALHEVTSKTEFQIRNIRLKQFDFSLNLNEEEIKMFHEKLTYPLEKLSFSLRPGLRFPALYNWITSLSATLTYLSLDFVLTPTSPEAFPCGHHLVNLRHLIFKNYFGCLDFLKDMQELTTLSLTNVNLSVAFPDEPEVSCDKMREFEIYSGHSNAGRISFDHIFKKIAKIFPNLTKFRADHMTDSNLKAIIKGCPLMEELLLVDSVITDWGLTGLTSERCIDLEQVIEHGTAEEMDFELLENEKIRGSDPRLADLKHLHSFHISSPKISDITVYYGLTLCSKLSHLCISSRLITGNVLNLALSKLKLQKLRISRCYRIDNRFSASHGHLQLLTEGRCGCGISETISEN